MAKKWLPALIVVGILAAAGGYLFAKQQDEVYEAEARVIIRSGEGRSADSLIVAQELANEYIQLVLARPNLVTLLDELGLDESVEQFRDRVSLRLGSGAPVIIAGVEDGDPAAARAAADALAAEIIGVSEDQADVRARQAADAAIASVNDEIARAQARLDELNRLPVLTPVESVELREVTLRLSDLQTSYSQLLPSSSAGRPFRVEVLDPAIQPTDPVAPRPTFFAILVMMVALILVAGIAVVLELLDDRLRRDQDLETIAGAPVLGAVTERKGDIARGGLARAVTLTYPESPEAESFQQLRARTEAALGGRLRTLLVTSGDGRPDAAAVAANLAIAWARIGRRVLLIDADVRAPSLHRLFEVAERPGFAQLHGASPAAVKQMLITTPQPRLTLLGAGSGAAPGTASASISSSAFRALTAGEPAGFDLVVILGPALLLAAETVDLASWVEATLLVVPRSGLRGKRLREMIRALADAHANLVGVARIQTRRGSHPPVAKAEGKARE